MPEPRPTGIKVLPPDYNPNEDRGKQAWELFDDWMVPPDEVFIRKNEYGESVVLAYGGREITL